MKNSKLTALLLCLLTPLMLHAQGQGDSKIKVDYSITYDNKGSRSESRHHHLVINGQAVPEYFEWLIADGKLYQFSSRQNLWGDDGYVLFRADNPQYKEELSEETISASELKRGWYVSEKKKKKTPGHWCTVSRNGVTAFVNPDHFKDLADAQNWEIMSRYSREDLFLE